MDATRRRLTRKLRALRIAGGLTQAVLAQRAGITREYYARLEAGEHDPPLSRVGALAKALGVPVAELLK